MAETTTNCREENGITVGLVDSLISICRILKKRDLSPKEVKEALKDLRADEDLDHVLNSKLNERIMTKADLSRIVARIEKEKGQVNEDGASTGGLSAAGGAGTTTFSVMGATDSPTFGGFIGPLGRVSKRKLDSRLAPGYILAEDKEHIYTADGGQLTEAQIQEWFAVDMSKKPSWNGGKLVAIEPKCAAFPYCNQGAIDKPIKLIGESKGCMCSECYSYVSHIAEASGKTSEYIAKIIREKYLS